MSYHVAEGLSGRFFFSFRVCMFKSVSNGDKGRWHAQQSLWEQSPKADPQRGPSPVLPAPTLAGCQHSCRCPHLGFSHSHLPKHRNTQAQTYTTARKTGFAASTQINRQRQRQRALKHRSRKSLTLVVFTAHQSKTVEGNEAFPFSAA